MRPRQLLLGKVIQGGLKRGYGISLVFAPINVCGQLFTLA